MLLAGTIPGEVEDLEAAQGLPGGLEGDDDLGGEPVHGPVGAEGDVGEVLEAAAVLAEEEALAVEAALDDAQALEVAEVEVVVGGDAVAPLEGEVLEVGRVADDVLDVGEVEAPGHALLLDLELGEGPEAVRRALSPDGEALVEALGRARDLELEGPQVRERADEELVGEAAPAGDPPQRGGTHPDVGDGDPQATGDVPDQGRVVLGILPEEVLAVIVLGVCRGCAAPGRRISHRDFASAARRLARERTCMRPGGSRSDRSSFIVPIVTRQHRRRIQGQAIHCMRRR